MAGHSATSLADALSRLISLRETFFVEIPCSSTPLAWDNNGSKVSQPSPGDNLHASFCWKQLSLDYIYIFSEVVVNVIAD